MNGIALGFIPDTLVVALTHIQPSRNIPEHVLASIKFRQICSSIEEVGLIEPLVVTPADQQAGDHLLLDGHVRLIALTRLGYEAAPCLVATDDEAYTYNTRVNRLSSIEEHRMIRRAIERGVTKEHLAKALSVDVSLIIKKVNLLEGICPEVIELLRDREFSADISRVIRKMKPTRQIECVELMISANKVNCAFAEALLAATPGEMRVESKARQKLTDATQERMARLERELATLQGQYKVIEQTYAEDVLNFVLIRGYLGKLLGNPDVHRYLKQRHRDVLAEFESMVNTVSLSQG